MLISGFKQRSLADQNEVVEFNFNVVATKNSGNSYFGISGTNDFRFNLLNSKIYDPKGYLVGSYEQNVPLSISGQVGQTSYDYYINSQLIGLGVPYSGATYSSLYANSDSQINFNATIKGKTPDYSLDSTGEYLYQDYIITGRVINNNPSLKFRIFDATINQPSTPYFIQDFTTGDITNTGFIHISSNEIGLSDFLLPITLETNFGTVNFNFLISGDNTPVPDVYLNISPDSTNVLNNTSKNYNVQVSNYPSGTQLDIKLSYLSGITGNIYYFINPVQESNLIPLTGVITGAGTLSTLAFGVASGLDPLTNILETGLSSGYIQTNALYATGNVSEFYSITGFGAGQGTLSLSYNVSGATTGFYSGLVNLNGGIVQMLTYNFLGTGDTPGTGTGICPTGFSFPFEYPTGCVSISAPLTLGTDYFSGIIAAPQVFQGQLILPYSVLGIGWATGALFSGTVTTNFPALFDQGFYNFKKFYSGLVEGNLINTGNFDPVSCLGAQAGSTGILTGNFNTGLLLDCSFITGNLTIPVSGIPTQLYNAKGQRLDPNYVVLIEPSGGFGNQETSANALSGEFTRTKTSRMGNTPSGFGEFLNIVGDCTQTGATDISTATQFYNNHWKENISATTTTGKYDSINNYISNVSVELALTGTGNLSFTGSGTNPSPPQDSGILNFIITGAGTKTIGLKSLVEGFDEGVFDFYLYKNGVPTNVWGSQGINRNTQYGSADVVSGGAWDTWQSVLLNGTTDQDTVVLLEDLESGNYTLYVYANPLPIPQVYFSAPVFSGCESSQNIVFQVCVSGQMYKDVYVELKDYTEITAHSGVNYDPIYFVYTPDSLYMTGDIFKRTQIGIYFAMGDATVNSNGTPMYCQNITIPIYDNAAYGNDHMLLMALSNPSGATLPLLTTYDPTSSIYPFNTDGSTGSYSSAVIQIVENDNPNFVTGSYLIANPVVSGHAQNNMNVVPTVGTKQMDALLTGGGPTMTGLAVVVTSGLIFQNASLNNEDVCPYVGPMVSSPPPTPTQNSAGMDCPQPCCECVGPQTVTFNCPGYSQSFVESLVLKGSKCDPGKTTSSGCSTSCYDFLGELCIGPGSVFKDSFKRTAGGFNDGGLCGSGVLDPFGCAYKALVIDKGCFHLQDDQGDNISPENGGCAFGFGDTATIVSTSCEDTPIVNLTDFQKLLYATDSNGNQVFIDSCANYATANINGSCQTKLVFLMVNCETIQEEIDLGACCHSWTYSFWSQSTIGSTPTCPPPLG